MASSMSAFPVPPSGPKQPVVETPPDGDAHAEVSSRSLNLRIRQQEILAELGVTALKGTAFEQLLDLTVSLAAEGLEADLCKVLEYLPAEKRLLMRAGVGWDAGLVGSAKGQSGQIWVRLVRGEGETARITVRDEGAGLPPDFEIGQRGGLGMRLTMALAQQTDAVVRADRLEKGTEFVIELPLEPGK